MASTSLFLTSHDKFNSPGDIFPSSALTLVSVPHRSLPLKPAPIFCNFLRKIDCWIDEILGLDYDDPSGVIEGSPDGSDGLGIAVEIIGDMICNTPQKTGPTPCTACAVFSASASFDADGDIPWWLVDV